MKFIDTRKFRQNVQGKSNEEVMEVLKSEVGHAIESSLIILNERLSNFDRFGNTTKYSKNKCPKRIIVEPPTYWKILNSIRRKMY